MARLALTALVLVAVAACGGTAPSPGPTATGVTATALPAATHIATLAPVETPAPTAAPTAFPTATPEPAPIAITTVGCLEDQTVRLQVHIQDERGVVSYEVWSTWGGGGATTRSFPTPYRELVDETIEFTHAIVDPEPSRIHQFGLAVSLDGVADPIIVYQIEPGNRCPGH